MGNMEEEYAYQLIEFVRRGPTTTRREVDFVPCNWVIYNKKKRKLETKFLPPPYDEDNCKLLHDLVRMKADPPTDWPTYNVLVKGGARSYNDAVQRLKKLNNDEYAFTHDSDVTPQQKVEKIIEKHKQLKLKVSRETRAALQVPGLSEAHADTEEEIFSERKTKEANNKQSKILPGSDVDSAGTDDFPVTKSMNSKLSYAQVYSEESRESDESSANIIKPVSSSCGAIRREIFSKHDQNKSTKTTKTKGADKGSKTVSDSDVDSARTNDFSITKSKSLKLPYAKIYSNKSREEDKVRESSTHIRKSVNKSGGAIRRDVYSKKDKNNTCQTTKQRITEKTSASSSSGSAIVNNISFNDDQSKKHKIGEEKIEKVSESQLLWKIYNDLQEIKIDIKNIHTYQIESKQAQQGLQILQGIHEDFIVKNNVSLPIGNEREFNEFDLKLLTDADFGQEFIASLVKYFDRRYIASRTIANILRKYFSKHFAMNCTAIKKMPNKMLLKGTAFYDHLLGAVSQSHLDPISGKTMNDSTFGVVLGNVLSNAKDWGGGRKTRKTTSHDPLQESHCSSDSDL